jgi:hypothetical protein
LEKSSKGSGLDNASADLPGGGARVDKLDLSRWGAGVLPAVRPSPRAEDVTYPPAFGQRWAGPEPGTYVMTCDCCKGRGMCLVRGMNSIYEMCVSCDGVGALTVIGERHGDIERQSQPTWADVFTFVAIAVFVTAVCCGLIIWAANAIKP